MLHEWTTLFAPAVQDRMVLLLNHVLSRESHATSRLQAFSGRAVVIRLTAWPKLLPAAPDLRLAVTRAGLWERLEAAPAEALLVEIDASNPALMALGALSGEKPRVTVQGDAAFAGEMHWLMDNLRWDIEDDLAGLVGPAVAHQLGRFGRGIREALTALARQAENLRKRA